VRRVTLGLRVSADLKRKLEQDAERAGRTLSAEAEFRLEQSYDRRALIDMAIEEWRKSEVSVAEDWLKKQIRRGD
jgi:hypothetical protein